MKFLLFLGIALAVALCQNPAGSFSLVKQSLRDSFETCCIPTSLKVTNTTNPNVKKVTYNFDSEDWETC